MRHQLVSCALVVLCAAACERTVPRTGPLASLANSVLPDPVDAECTPNLLSRDTTAIRPIVCRRVEGDNMYEVEQDAATGLVQSVARAFRRDSSARASELMRVQNVLTSQLGRGQAFCTSDKMDFGVRWFGDGYYVSVFTQVSQGSLLYSYRLGRPLYVTPCNTHGDADPGRGLMPPRQVISPVHALAPPN